MTDVCDSERNTGRCTPAGRVSYRRFRLYTMMNLLHSELMGYVIKLRPCAMR